jgi:formylglycine-generating enzyme required for sulfatase activity
MAGKIFINYRRGDDPGFAQALFGRLEQAFPSEQLFMDVDNIEPGLDFVRMIEEQVAQCDVLISVIGKNWTGARDETGCRRLDNPDDFVRIEIESALSQDKRVIPVLVGEASMPRADEVPESMKPLLRRHAVRLTHERFRADTEALIAALQRALNSAEEAQQTATDEQRLGREAQAKQRRREAAEAEPPRRRGGAAKNGGERPAPTSSRSGAAGRESPKRRDEAEERGQVRRWQAGPLWPPSRPVLAAGCLLAVVLLGAVGVWLAKSPTSVSVTPAPPASIAPAPAPGGPTQQATNAPLPAAQERALKPRNTFKECTNCPVMMVVPAGRFTMGSPASEPGRDSDEGPPHTVTIAQQFAVGKNQLTFDEWDACVADDGCHAYRPPDQGWGRGTRPVINVSWDVANAYVEWLAKKTGKPYRLLSEAEYEYVARAGTMTAYPWGDAIGTNNANCDGCGSKWDGKQTASVGSFAANGFGLNDMVGNVWEWTQDCYHDSYNGAPADGTAWTSGVCTRRILRGGSWGDLPRFLRSAVRDGNSTDYQINLIGFRVGRTLLTP